MLIDQTDYEQMGDAKLARTNPEAYEAKMRAREEYNPVKSLINFFRNLLVKKTK